MATRMFDRRPAAGTADPHEQLFPVAAPTDDIRVSCAKRAVEIFLNRLDVGIEPLDPAPLIDNLNASLDLEQGGEIAANLRELYGYACRRLLEANVRNDAAMLDEVAGLLREIKSAWDALPGARVVIGRVKIQSAGFDLAVMAAGTILLHGSLCGG